MNQDPEHEDYDDDEYNYYSQYNQYGYPSEYSKKSNIDWAAWEQWILKTIKEMSKEDANLFVLGNELNYDSQMKKQQTIKENTLSDKFFMYLGSNYYDEAIWKTKYFLRNEINQSYKNHLTNHASHFVRQPHYYKSMFDILN